MAAAPGDGQRIGDYVLVERLRRDRLGEVYSATGPGGPVRVRLTAAGSGSSTVDALLSRSRRVSSPSVAPILDTLADDTGRVAVITPADRITLAERRHRRRPPVDAVVAMGPVLLDGLAALHAAGLAHGAVEPAAVGIDAAGSPRWQDSALALAARITTADPDAAAGLDLADCAAMLRDLTRLPLTLARIVDPVASGAPGALDSAAELAAAWRAVAGALGLPTPPTGAAARIPALLPQPRPLRLRRRGLPRLTPRTRAAAAAVVAAATVGLPAAAWAVPGRATGFERLDAYVPHRGERLTYRLGAQGPMVTLRVAEAATVAGVFTVSTRLEGGSQAGLPLGLEGSTVRVESGGLVRTASGGTVRDLIPPLAPGTTWSDVRSGVGGGITVTERRAILGPVDLVEPGGRFSNCIAVGLVSSTTSAGGPGTTATGTAWFCPGVGLARAVLRTGGSGLDIDLVAAG